MDLQIEVVDSTVTTPPARFDEAIELVRQRRLEGLAVTDDYAAPGMAAPRCDLRRLERAPWLRAFSVLPGIAKSRLEHFDGLYALDELRALAIHEYDALDVHRLPKLETLSVRDRPGLRGMESLPNLRHLRVWAWRTASLAGYQLPRLEVLWLAQVASSVKRLDGLDRLGALKTLEIHHSRGLSTLGPMPPSLRTLRIQATPRLKDLAFLAQNESLEFVFVEIVADLEFVPTMRSLARIGFGDVESGDLSPLLRSTTLQAAFFAPRKKYSPSYAEIQRELEKRGGEQT